MAPVNFKKCQDLFIIYVSILSKALSHVTIISSMLHVECKTILCYPAKSTAIRITQWGSGEEVSGGAS